MTNTNNLIPKENKKPVEVVHELKDEYKIPSFEEFMKDYNENEKVIDNYRGEFEGYKDMRLKGTYYGPGFWSDFWDEAKVVVKPVATGALVVASVFPPTAAIAAPAAFTVIGTGAATMGIGHLSDSEGLKEFGRDLVEIGSGARDGQEVTESPTGIRSGSLNEYARSRNRN